jgi:hypothetical protein
MMLVQLKVTSAQNALGNSPLHNAALTGAHEVRVLTKTESTRHTINHPLIVRTCPLGQWVPRV